MGEVEPVNDIIHLFDDAGDHISGFSHQGKIAHDIYAIGWYFQNCVEIEVSIFARYLIILRFIDPRLNLILILEPGSQEANITEKDWVNLIKRALSHRHPGNLF